LTDEPKTARSPKARAVFRSETARQSPKILAIGELLNPAIAGEVCEDDTIGFFPRPALGDRAAAHAGIW
jgi:hypothetical protein